MSRLKTGPCSKDSQIKKKNTIIIAADNPTSFVIEKVKESFQKFKKVFYKKPILQHFDISKPIIVEPNVSEKVIRDILSQQNIDQN